MRLGAHDGSARLSSALLVAAGLAPGLLDPRAFVVGSVLCLAGLLALGLPGPDAGPHAVAAPRPSLLHDEPAEVLSGVRRASVG